MVGRPARRPDRTTVVNSGRRRRRACAGNTSGGELLASLAPTAGEDRPARAGTHPQAEAVGLRATTVVRLERALAHEVLPLHDIGGAHSPVGGCARGSRTTVRRLSVTPEAGHCGRRAPTDSGQHNRGRATAGGRAHPDRPWSTRRRPRRGRRAEPTRPGELPERCRAVDGAVSVAVAPRRTSGSRRAGRPRRSSDRRTARSPARNGL